MRTPTRLLVTVTAAAMLTTAVQATRTPTAAAAPVTCAGTAKVFDTRADGSLWYYEHRAPATGDMTWTEGRRIGDGFHGTTLASADGTIYYINAAGELRRYRYDGTRWTDGAGTVIGTGFGAWANGSNKATVDARGRLFLVDVSLLKVYRYTDNGWDNAAGDNADIAWLDYDMVVGAGDNVLYGRDGSGRLFRFRYDPVSQRWTDHRRQVGAGWQMFDRVFSPGGDVLYSITGGTMYWYRFDADTGTWANGGNGRVVGSGWSGRLDVSATSNTCSTPAPAPVPPVTPLPADPAAPLATVGAQNPRPHFSVVRLDANANAVAALDLGDRLAPTPLGGPAFGGGLTTATSGFAQHVAGVDRQGTVWLAQGKPPASAPTWSPFRSLGGSLTSVGLAAHGAAGVDSGGRLWFRPVADGAYGGWWDMSGPAGYTGELSVADLGGSTYGVLRRADGSVHSFHVLRWALNISKVLAYRSGPLPAAAAFGMPTPANVAYGDMLVARQTATGRPFALFGDEGDWDTTWTLLPALDLADEPLSAAQLRNEARAVAALGADGHVYVTIETRAASRQFLAWQRVGDTKAVTPPTLTSPERGDAEVAFLGEDGQVHHYTALVQANWYEPLTFTGGPRG